MFEWLSDNRALVASIIIILCLLSFLVTVFIGLRTNFIRPDKEVFGDPERTKGGWYWAICGISALLLIWFYFSWGVGRAYFPDAANEMCQVAKIEEAISPITASLPVNSRYYKSTSLVKRNIEQLDELAREIRLFDYAPDQQSQLLAVIKDIENILASLSNPAFLKAETQKEIDFISNELIFLAEKFDQEYLSFVISSDALLQDPWGTSDVEIPMLPQTKRGIMYDQISLDVKSLSKRFLKLRHFPEISKVLIEETKEKLKDLKNGLDETSLDEVNQIKLAGFIKYADRIFKRVDDGNIFPPGVLKEVTSSSNYFLGQLDESKGTLALIDIFFFPGQGVVKSKTKCTEQGSARWLPKPTDVVAKFAVLANPNIEAGGGYKGFPLLWWEWVSIGNLVGFFVPDIFVDLLVENYSEHLESGTFEPNFYDKLLFFAQGELNLGYIPFPNGHIWDSLVRVIVAMFFGIILGVPLGIYMGISKFFKSFFDPLIELYRPVPPLAWAPLILTIFGIQDDGKIFLLFMVAFAIMVISARTGASGTQLSKIRASHSLGATNGQILRYVILPNALPEILTGVRISIGVCWGTLVAAEMLAGTTGVGFIENVARTVSDYELIWVTILIMGLLGLFFDIIMRILIARLIPWRGKG